jgi:hypothetical protein
VEKTGERDFEKTVVRGSGLAFALDESGAEHWHVGRMPGIVVRPATDLAVAPDCNETGQASLETRPAIAS